MSLSSSLLTLPNSSPLSCSPNRLFPSPLPWPLVSLFQALNGGTVKYPVQTPLSSHVSPPLIPTWLQSKGSWGCHPHLTERLSNNLERRGDQRSYHDNNRNNNCCHDNNKNNRCYHDDSNYNFDNTTAVAMETLLPWPQQQQLLLPLVTA